MTLAPARLAPIFVQRIWGSRNLAPLFQAPTLSSSSGGPALGAKPIGEVWLTGDKCVFNTGPLAGRSLAAFQASIAGGIAIGMMEALMAGYGTSLYAEPAIFVLILLVLFVRPYGLLGDYEAQRR